MSEKSIQKGVSVVKWIGTLGITAVAGAIAYSRFGINHSVPMPPVLEADLRRFQSEKAGRLSYYADTSGTGRPLLLIHSINAAPSAHEIKPLFRYYQGKRPVYALDLPGFGFSERGRRDYTPEMYTAAIIDLVAQEIGEAVDLVALSLGGEFAAYAALARPELFNSLVLISPSGLGPREIRLPSDKLYRFFSFPLWSQPLFDLLTSRVSISYYTGRSFVGIPPQTFIDYAYTTSHQPEARFAPLKFLSGRLFTPDVRTAVYEKVTRPTLVIYDQDPNVSFDKLPDLLQANPNWRAERLAPSNGLPHWDNFLATKAVLEQFWA